MSERVLFVGAAVVGAVGVGIVAARRRDRDQDDVVVAMLDLWAALGDVLSAYQDLMAEEAYLSTASQRRSLRSGCHYFSAGWRKSR